MRITKKKAVVVIAVAAVATAGAGGAFAYWTTGGTGTGSASAGTSTEFTVEQVGSVIDLFPGVAKTIDFKITNTASFAQYLTDVDVTVDQFTAGANAAEPDCTEADFAITDIVVTAGQIAAGGNKTGTAKITLKNLDTNQDNCKGASVPLTITAS